MCLIKGLGAVKCSQPTCIRSAEDPNFRYTTKSASFRKTADFNKVTLYFLEDRNHLFIRPRNPHSQRSDNWGIFEDFKDKHVFYAVGTWPEETLLNKVQVDFEYHLYGRRIATYDPLTETDVYHIVLDVEEAAVYVGN